MTRRELNLAIFAGTADRPLWQPRLEEWVSYNARRSALPERFRDRPLLEIYDDLRCSARYYASSWCDTYHDEGAVESWQETLDEQHTAYHWRTCGGQITAVHQLVREGEMVVNDRIRQFPVQDEQGLQVLVDMTRATHYRVNAERMAQTTAEMGDRGEPTGWLNSNGFTELIKSWAGLPGTYYLLADAPAAVEAYMEATYERDMEQVELAVQTPLRIFNLGDHTTNEFAPPPILRRFVLPHWQRISAKLSAAGRYVHSHWDGNSRTLLPYLRESGLHGVEALPPLPMGDMTLEEIKAAVGDDLVVLDLIPATHFLPHFSVQACLDLAARIMDIFTPRLILGVSDEISGVGDIARIEAISQLVDKRYGLAD